MAKLMSERLKYELAKELGVDHLLRQNGGDWGEMPSRACGSLVRAAIDRAERALVQQQEGSGRGQ